VIGKEGCGGLAKMQPWALGCAADLLKPSSRKGGDERACPENPIHGEPRWGMNFTIVDYDEVEEKE